MATGYLMDTSAVIKYFSYALTVETTNFIDNVIDEKCVISFITGIELQAWNPTEKDDLMIYEQFVNKATVIGITDQIIQKTIEIRRNNRLKIPDAIIAATAIANSLTLISDNDKDFLKVEGLSYLNPKHIT